MDGLQPIIKEFILEFASGEETILELDYESLGNHCSLCNHLAHVRSHSPDRLSDINLNLNDSTRSPAYERPRNSIYYDSHRSQTSRATETTRGVEAAKDQFHQRLDRHGRLFRQQIAAVPTTVGIKNRITPAPDRPTENNITKRHQREYPSRYHYGNFPPYFTRIGPRQSQQDA